MSNLKNVRKTLEESRYKCPKNQDSFRKLMQPDDFQSKTQADGHLTIFFITIVISINFALNNIWLAIIVALFLHETFSSFFKV